MVRSSARLVAPLPDLAQPLIVAVVGSRDYPNLSRVERYVTKLAAKHPQAVIVSGGARGVDQMAEKISRWSGLGMISYRPYEFDAIDGSKEYSITTFTRGELAQEIVVAKKRRINPPTFKSYGAAAFYRNSWIAEDCTVMVAFHRDNSPGTARSIRVAREFGRQVFAYK